MAKGWYVVHTYSGYENKVEKHIRVLIDRDVFGGAVTDIKVPSEEIVEMREGKKKVTNRKFLPGYILLEMDLPDDNWKAICSEVRKIQGVTGFVGVAQQEIEVAGCWEFGCRAESAVRGVVRIS